MKSSNYTCRIDTDLRTRSNAIFNDLGLTLGTAINIFLRKAVSVGGFPFDVRLENEQKVTGDKKLNSETVEALLEAERIARDPSIPAYSVEDALKELKNEI